MSPVACAIHQNCPEAEYCDSVIHRCTTCVGICNPKKGPSSMEQCKRKCQVYYIKYLHDRKPTNPTSASTEKLIHTTVTPAKIQRDVQESPFALYLLVALVVVIIALILVAVIIFGLKVRKKRQKSPRHGAVELNSVTRNGCNNSPDMAIEMENLNNDFERDTNESTQHQDITSPMLSSRPSFSIEDDYTDDVVQSDRAGTNQNVPNSITSQVHNETCMHSHKNKSKAESIKRSTSEMIPNCSDPGHRSSNLCSVPRTKSTMSRLRDNSGDIINDSIAATGSVKSKSASISQNQKKNKGVGKSSSRNTRSLPSNPKLNSKSSGQGTTDHSLAATGHRNSMNDSSHSNAAGQNNINPSSRSKSGSNNMKQSSKKIGTNNAKNLSSGAIGNN